MISQRRVFASAVALMLTVASTAAAAEWGTLKGRFVYEGKAEQKKVTLTQNVDYCSKHHPLEETVVTGDKGGLQNVFVYLAVDRGDKVEIHESYDDLKGKPVVLDNVECRFEPHALTLWTERPLEVKNSDPGLAHNTNATKLFENKAKAFNETVPNDKPLVKEFDKSERYPVGVSCNVHPWMNANILVRDNPYMTVSGEDGSFEIKNLPAGKHTFVFWHEAKGNMRDLKVGKEKASRKGEVDIEIPAGETVDLGEIKVAPSILGQKG